MSKGASRLKCIDTRQQCREIKSFGLKNQTSIKCVFVIQRAATPCITPTVKHEGGSVMMWEGLLPIVKSGICTTAASCDPIWNATCGSSRIHTQAR